MPNTPPVLKWLAETRARVADRLERSTRTAEYCERRASNTRRHLQEKLAHLQKRLSVFEASAENALRLTNAHRANLESLDMAIVEYEPRVRPEQIEPINGWQGKYGKRGGLRGSVLQLLDDEYPNWIPTSHIKLLLLARFDVRMTTPAQRRAWHDTLKSTLRILLEDGLVDKLNAKGHGQFGVNSWRKHKAGLPTLAELRARRKS